MVLEYAAQIEAHMTRLMSQVAAIHWRTSPQVLSGMRVAVFRKTSGPAPTIITGTAIEANTSISYSKLRVAFDGERDKATSKTPFSSNGAAGLSVASPAFNTQSPSAAAPSLTASEGVQPFLSHSQIQYQSQLSHPSHSQTPLQVIGDITEPFWVQSCSEGAVWGDPDDLCMTEARRIISTADKRIFWEMARSIMVS